MTSLTIVDIFFGIVTPRILVPDVFAKRFRGFLVHTFNLKYYTKTRCFRLLIGLERSKTLQKPKHIYFYGHHGDDNS